MRSWLFWSWQEVRVLGLARVLVLRGLARSEHLARRWSAQASAHGVVGATEGLLPPAFALPTSVRLEPGREGVWIVWIMLGAQSCPEDLVLEDRTRLTGRK